MSARELATTRKRYTMSDFTHFKFVTFGRDLSGSTKALKSFYRSADAAKRDWAKVGCRFSAARLVGAGSLADVKAADISGGPATIIEHM